MNNISFKAHYVANINLLKKNKEGVYQPCDVSIVSINRNHEQDYSALEKICTKWKGHIFCDVIKESVNSSYSGKNIVFAVTEQKINQSTENYLDYNKIICLANLKLKSNKTKIYQLESIPESVSTEYNHAGTSLVKYLQTQTKKIELFCPSIPIIEQFYYKLGFKHKHPNSKLLRNYGELYWTNDKSSFKDKILFLYKKLFFNIKK